MVPDSIPTSPCPVAVPSCLLGTLLSSPVCFISPKETGTITTKSFLNVLLKTSNSHALKPTCHSVRVRPLHCCYRTRQLYCLCISLFSLRSPAVFTTSLRLLACYVHARTHCLCRRTFTLVLEVCVCLLPDASCPFFLPRSVTVSPSCAVLVALFSGQKGCDLVQRSSFPPV